ncbi:MAG: site-2 protease family protein [Desulfobacterales bacterium]|nr:site-2 protease family protein [Desulfobacterales bacterium]
MEESERSLTTGARGTSGPSPSAVPAAPPKPNRSGIFSIALIAGALALKFLKPLLIGLKAFKAGAFLKTGLTMVLSMWAYALAWGWAYGAAFVLLIFVHEMGHVYALKEFKIRASVPIFIPFLGAFVALKEMPRNVRIEAWIGIAGPLVGTGGAMLCWSAALYTGSSFWMAVAYTGFFLNLFNLIPISPLDGGRVVAAISPKLWILGFVGLLILFVRSFNPILLFILLPAGRNVYNLRKRKDAVPAEYYAVDTKTKGQISLLYFGLLLFLAIAMSLTHVAR